MWLVKYKQPTNHIDCLLTLIALLFLELTQSLVTRGLYAAYFLTKENIDNSLAFKLLL